MTVQGVDGDKDVEMCEKDKRRGERLNKCDLEIRKDMTSHDVVMKSSGKRMSKSVI